MPGHPPKTFLEAMSLLHSAYIEKRPESQQRFFPEPLASTTSQSHLGDLTSSVFSTPLDP